MIKIWIHNNIFPIVAEHSAHYMLSTALYLYVCMECSVCMFVFQDKKDIMNTQREKWKYKRHFNVYNIFLPSSQFHPFWDNKQ